jgi:hypothetical protein
MRVVRVPSEEILAAAPASIADADLSPDEEEFLEEFPLVLVTWHDAFFDFDQAGPDDFRPDYVVRTVGFLVHEGPRFVSIAQEVLPDGEGFRAVTHIPLSIVESVTALQAGPTATAAG